MIRFLVIDGERELSFEYDRRRAMQLVRALTNTGAVQVRQVALHVKRWLAQQDSHEH